MSSRDFRIFLLLCIAALAASLVWVSIRERDRTDSRVAPLAQRVATLAQRVSTLEADLKALRAEADRRLQDQSEQLARLREAGPAGLHCLAQVQQEIDDIRGFIAFGDAIRRRVTDDCKDLLKPRYGG